MFPRIFQLVLLNDDVRLNKFLDEHPLTVNEQHKGITPIFFAIYHHSELSISVLIQRGANLEFIVDYQNPLAYAARFGSLFCVKELVQAKVKFSTKQAPSPLETILCFDDIEKFKLIADYYPNILTNEAKIGLFQKHPVYLAIQAKATKCISYLLMNNPKFQTIFSEDGQDSLELAITLLDLETVTNITNLEGFKTFLRCHNHKYFLHEAAKVKPYGITEIVKKKQIIEQLLKFIEDPNERDKNGNTPLHMVSDVRTARQLVASGCDIKLKNEHGYLPKDCVELFDSNNEDLNEWFIVQEEITSTPKK